MELGGLKTVPVMEAGGKGEEREKGERAGLRAPRAAPTWQDRTSATTATGLLVRPKPG